MYRIILSILCSFYAFAIQSQQIVKQNFYHYNLNYINPAATGCSPCKTFHLADRHQWVGIKGAPSTQVFSAQIPKAANKYKKHGLGANFVRDVNGATQNLSGEFLYSFHFTVGSLRKSNLSFGLSGSFGQNSMDERDFTEGLPDPIISRGIQQELTYNASTGFFLHNEKYFVGAAVYNLLPINSSLFYDYGHSRFLTTLIAGYNFSPRNNDYILKSSIYGCRGNNFYQFDINNHLYFKNNVWTGVTIRKYIGEFQNSGQNLLMFLGYQFDKWNLAYTYDLGINKLQANHLGSHQFSVSYRICKDKYACPTYKK